MLRIKIVQMLLLCCFFSTSVYAVDPQKQTAPLDQIAAVVNDDVITRHELEVRYKKVVKKLSRQGTSLPSADALRKQILERMIIDMLQAQLARQTGIQVDDTQLDKSLQRIAKENKFATLAEFREQLSQEGVNYKKFREEIRAEIVMTRLREREVESKLVISPSEVDNYLVMQSKKPGNGEEFQLARIMVMVPEQASAENIQASRLRAEKALSRLQGGTPFAEVAAEFSDAKDAMNGGVLKPRTANRLPKLFVDALQKMKISDFSPVLRSPNGFHIIKLIDKRSKDAPVVITQTHARHLLIKTSASVSESEAKKQLLDIKKQIEAGDDFATLAKRYSEDGSASQGGDLGWLSPGSTVSEFEQAMDALKVGQVSDVVQTVFGWHLIQVLGRRNTDVSEEQKRQQAFMAIRGLKSEEAFQDWLRQLRDRAYIENRLQQDN